MADKVETIKGKDRVTFLRPYKERATMPARLVPYQTSLTFDPSVDTDSTATKDGNVNSIGAVETDWEFEAINSTSEILDKTLAALFAKEKMEIWLVNRARKNADGKYEAWYGQGIVSEDSSDNDADDNSTRDITMTIDGTPKHGWVELSDVQQEEIDYVFYGLGAVTDADKTGAGTAFDESKDAGVNVADAPKA